jgi:hypothetical protein
MLTGALGTAEHCTDGAIRLSPLDLLVHGISGHSHWR